MPPPTSHRPALFLLLVVALAPLACNTFTNFLELEGPEDKATDSFFFPTDSPVPEVTLPPPATPEAAFALTLDEADDAQAAMRPAFVDDLARDALAGATRYVLDVTVTVESQRAATIAGRVDIRYTNQTGALSTKSI